MVSTVFNRGDVVTLEVTKRTGRAAIQIPALVLSSSAFNATGLALVAPITYSSDVARFAGFAVPVEGYGTAIISHARMLDLEARKAAKVQAVASESVEDALARFQAILA